MNIKFFGQFLLEKGIISREQILNALDAQRKSSPLLGDISVEKQWIDSKQAEKINMEQRRQDKRFGEIAVGLSLLNENQIDELLEEQKSRRKYFGEILVDMSYITPDVLEEQLKAHKKDSMEFSDQIESTLDDAALPKQTKLVNDTFSRFYQRMLKMAISTTEVLSTEPSNDGELYFWSQQVQSNKCYRILLSMNKDHACHIASNFLNMAIDEMNELTVDAVSEFLNTFTGHVYSKLSENSQPKVMAPEHHDQKFDINFESCTSLKLDCGRFQVTVSIGVEA